MGGNFNIITSLDEKHGGTHCLDQEALRLDYIHGIIVWGVNQIASHIDRFLVFESLLLTGLHMDTSILSSIGSDHWPITLYINLSCSPNFHPFHFESF
jgi:endonuclease/exonuclease/phosphatase family metal-dependent hydrolase